MFTPSGFLKIGGLALIAAAIIGLSGVFSFTAENWVYMITGLAALVGAFTFNAEMQKWFTLMFAAGALALVIYDVYYNTISDISHINVIFHSALGVWALIAGIRRPKPMMGMPA